MGWLSSLLAGAFTSLFAIFGTILGKRLAFTLAMVTATAAAFAGMLVLTDAAIASVAEVVPTFAAVPASWILPNNIGECVAARLAASVAIFGYRWYKDVVTMATAGA